MRDKLSRSMIYGGFRGVLTDLFGKAEADGIWSEANRRLLSLAPRGSKLDRDSKMMVLPAAALYLALRERAPEQALSLLTDYGTHMGQKIGGAVHAITSIPGVPKLLWAHMPRLMRAMSAPEKGYIRRIVSADSGLVGVDILSCPLHNAAVDLGIPEAALVVCAMDKAYMTGFRHIRYTRTGSVAQGDACCDYRLQYDETKQ